MYTEMLHQCGEYQDTHSDLSCRCALRVLLHTNASSVGPVKRKKKSNGGVSVEVHHNTHATCSKVMIISLELYVVLTHIWVYEIEHIW